MPSNLNHAFVEANGQSLHTVSTGSGPLVLLLHGFPEFWYSWRHQLPALAALGYRAVAVDMRGYNLSSKPTQTSNYHVDHLADDVAALIEALGYRDAILIGHDWGAIVAWFTAMRHPSRVRRLVVMNVPHPAHYERMLFAPAQLRRSWYIFFFQLPEVAERYIASHDYRYVRRMLLRTPRNPHAFSAEDIERYVEAMRQPGAARAVVSYYRMLLRMGPIGARRRMRRIEVPTLVLWGVHDHFLGREWSAPPRHWVPNCEVAMLDDASHWVQVDRPDEVNRRLARFLGTAERGGAR
jgi:pimeloyl-ACP methyl ester carboxylesterase